MGENHLNNKYKVYVYAICKNEEKFVERWMESVREADDVIVLDTGSTDHSVQMLKGLGAIVYVEEIKPWRFDVARNRSLELVPNDADICVCTDLDEFLRPGWRKILEEKWESDSRRGMYRYTWSFNADGSEGLVFWISKIHTRWGFKWVHPVHEVLDSDGIGFYKTTKLDGIQLHHHPDPSKPRSQYLPLLELGARENPMDDRNIHYLGREYMYYRMWDKCIDTLKRHLSLPTATWEAERAASMRYIARSYKAKNDLGSSKNWYYRAIAEASYLREGYMELAQLFYEQEEWSGCYFMVQEALKIKERSEVYMNEAEAWGVAPYDLGAISGYYLGLFKESLRFAQKAIEIVPDDFRLQHNYNLILEAQK